jgi:bacterial/archaeal transporter family-2 protein
MTWLYAGLALLSGALLAVQVGLNNGLRERMSQPISAALISFATGTMALFAFALMLRPGWPKAPSLAGSPWWIWLGGVVGASYIMLTITFSSRLGAAGWLGVVVTGQILTSVLLDHYGLVGFARNPVSPWRVVGVVLLLAGAAIVLGTRDQA